MYYRYKVKKKKKGYAKAIVIVILAVSLSCMVYHFRSHLLFWRYTFNKLEGRIHAVQKIPDYDQRKKSLEDMVDIVNHYMLEHEGDPSACFMSGLTHYLYGESLLGKSFSMKTITEDEFHVDDKARNEFLLAIRHMKKGLALKESTAADEGYALMLARAYYYTAFESPQEIKKSILSSISEDSIVDIEDIRFVTVIHILTGQADYGIQLLTRKGIGQGDIEGSLFMAACQKLALMYTGAIITYQDVIRKSQDPSIWKLAYVNLGKIYFNQTLYQESIDSFSKAFEADGTDVTPKIWIGRNYLAQGNRDKAKAVWMEALALDKDNAEVKELLQVM